MRCDVDGYPQPRLVWYINAVELTSSNLPLKYSFFSNYTALTITNVCKTCPGTYSYLLGILGMT